MSRHRQVAVFSQTTSASPAQLWRLAGDAATWPAWVSGCREVRLRTPLRCSARGRRLRDRGGSEDFVVTIFVPGKTYAETVRLLGARIVSRRDLRSHGDGSEVTVAVTLTGPLAPLYRRSLRDRLATTLPAELSRLADLAERGLRGPEQTTVRSPGVPTSVRP